MPNNRYSGTLKVYDPVKGFGFITRPKGKDVFVLFSDFENGNDATAFPGTQVEFDIIEKEGSKGPRASKVIIIG
jgi:CspA family cold shock protein